MPHLPTHPIHLAPGGRATAEPAFTGMEWYDAYAGRHATDGAEGRLVSQYSFDADWAGWEVHHDGAEVVICTAGAITLVQEQADGSVVRTPLGPGDYAINPPGVWHTADVGEGGSATCIFITPGMDTRHRPR
jgi:quercetin dioxygenase-like cupin family protein